MLTGYLGEIAENPRITVRNLLASTGLSGHVLVGGAEGLGREVNEIVLQPRSRARKPPRQGEVLVFDASQMADRMYLIDRAIRSAADCNSAAVVVVAPPVDDLGAAARRLADRYSIPVVVLVDGDALTLTHQLRAEVWQPEIEYVVSVDLLVRSLDMDRVSSVAGAMEVIAAVANAKCALIRRDGSLVAGSSIDVAGRRVSENTAGAVDRSSEAALFSVPISLAPGEGNVYWLLAESEASVSAQRSLESLLRIGSWYLSTLLAGRRAGLERDARQRIAVLNEILDPRDAPESDLRLHVEKLDWSWSGWNTGIHIRLSGEVDASLVLGLTSEMRHRLADVGLAGPLAERSDGWAGWVTHADEPRIGDYAQVTLALADSLDGLVAAHSGLIAHGGIGRPCQGLAGLRQTLGEAHEAALISQAEHRGSSGTSHIDQIGAKRVLMGWFSSDEFAGYAETALRPLLEVDHGGALRITLETFLDCNCSTTDAAHVLGVHRNTVSNRVRRASELLGARLDDPETRLSLQLACRMMATRG